MIGLDTNVLVRLVVGDDPRQTYKARLFVSRYCTPDSPGFIDCVVLAEFVWVLGASYGYARSEIAATVALREGRGSFADALIAALGARAGCSATVTFDRRALRLPGFELLSAP